MTIRLNSHQHVLDTLVNRGGKWVTLEHDPERVEQQVQNSIVWDSWINPAEYKCIDSEGSITAEYKSIVENVARKSSVTDMVLHSELQGRKNGKHSMARAARAQAKARKRRR